MTLLITGASGLLGAYLLHEARDGPVAAWSGSSTGDRAGVALRPVDLADPAALATAFHETHPTMLIHAAAMSAAARCRLAADSARRINTNAAAHLAELAAAAGARFVLVSTDMVFDGERGGYREDDEPAPLSVYGRTKADAERDVLAAGGVVARVSLLYGPSLTGRSSFFDQQVEAIAAQRPCPLFEDEWRTPLGLHTAARALVALARSSHPGIVHLGGPERLSRLEMGRRLSSFLGRGAAGVVATSRLRAEGEPRPRDLSLDSSRWRGWFPGLAWPTFEESLAEMGMRSVDRLASPIDRN